MPDVIYVLQNGYHEKRKTCFDEGFGTWKYAIREKTLDNIDLRTIVAFDDEMLIIITL